MESATFTTLAHPLSADHHHSRAALLLQALLNQFQGTKVNLLALHFEGETLVAQVNDEEADEPLCPAAFRRLVQRLSYHILGETVEARLVAENWVAESAPAPLHRVA